MKNIGEEIHHIMESKRLVKREVAHRIGKDPSYIGQLRSRDSIDAGLLEKISFAIGVSPAYFFDDWDCEGYTRDGLPAAPNKDSKAEQECERLRELLAEKDKLIADKERFINYLLSQQSVSDDVRP